MSSIVKSVNSVDTSVSYTKKFINDMIEIEKGSDHTIDNTCIINITLSTKDEEKDEEKRISIIKKLLHAFPILFIYHFSRKNEKHSLLEFICMLRLPGDDNFKSICDDQKKPYTIASPNKKFPSCVFDSDYRIYNSKMSSFIVSFIMRNAAQDMNIDWCNAYCLSVQKPIVFCYLNWKVYDNQLFTMSSLSKGKILKKDMANLTREDIITKLQEYGVDWSTLPKKIKYGSFFKFGPGKSKKIAFIEKCFMPTFADYEKYQNFFFSSEYKNDT